MLILYKSAIVFMIIFNFISAMTPTASDAEIDQKNIRMFESLENRLISDDFDKKTIETIYNSPKVYFEYKGLSMFFAHKESSLNYNQFTDKKSIEKTKKYIQKNKTAFLKAEKEYEVDKNIIAAIILVETRLGATTGNRSVLNSLSTMAALYDSKVRAAVWKKISKSSNLSKTRFDQKAKKKSEWAYKELKAFIKYTLRENIDPCPVMGSYAGAVGIAQFMPSNILVFGKDGNKDGRIDLFNHTDAIISIAAFLKHYGWHTGIENKKAYDVLYHYNHSKYYVNIILKISKLLRD